MEELTDDHSLWTHFAKELVDIIVGVCQLSFGGFANEPVTLGRFGYSNPFELLVAVFRERDPLRVVDSHGVLGED